MEIDLMKKCWIFRHLRFVFVFFSCTALMFFSLLKTETFVWQRRRTKIIYSCSPLWILCMSTALQFWRSGRWNGGFVWRPQPVCMTRHHNPALWHRWHHIIATRASFANFGGQDYSVDFQTSKEWVSETEGGLPIMWSSAQCIVVCSA